MTKCIEFLFVFIHLVTPELQFQIFLFNSPITRVMQSKYLVLLSSICNQAVFILRASFPKQVGKKSRGPQGERGLEFSTRKKRQTFFPPLHSLALYNNNVSCLRTVSGLNLLANSVILKCKLWE